MEGPLTEDDINSNMYSPIQEHFPEKVHMNKSHIDYKEFLPVLDLKIKKNTIQYKIKNEDQEKKLLPVYFETKEWQEILKIVLLTQEEVNRLIKNKMVSKLMNAFEILSKFLNEKNIQIKNFESVYDTYQNKINELNNENLILTKHCHNILQQSSQLKFQYQNYVSTKENGNSNVADNLDESLVGNVSKLTIQNLNNSSILMNYDLDYNAG